MLLSRTSLAVCVIAALASATTLPLFGTDPVSASHAENVHPQDCDCLAERVRALEDRIARLEERLARQPLLKAPCATPALPSPYQAPEKLPSGKYRANIILLNVPNSSGQSAVPISR